MKMYNMQALHCKIDVILVQILRYNCSETDYSLCEDSPPSRTPPSTQMRVSPSDPFSPHYFFRSAALLRPPVRTFQSTALKLRSLVRVNELRFVDGCRVCFFLFGSFDRDVPDIHRVSQFEWFMADETTRRLHPENKR